VDRARAIGLRFIHIDAGANSLERRFAISGSNEFGQGTGLTGGRWNGRSHKQEGENETLH
jgi:hypothetical protein